MFGRKFSIFKLKKKKEEKFRKYTFLSETFTPPTLPQQEAGGPHWAAQGSQGLSKITHKTSHTCECTHTMLAPTQVCTPLWCKGPVFRVSKKPITKN